MYPLRPTHADSYGPGATGSSDRRPGAGDGGGVYRSPVEAYGRWVGGVLGAQEALARSALRSTEDTLDVWRASGGARGAPLESFFRSGGLTLSWWFASVSGALAAGDHLGRASGASSALSPRALALATVALELYLGYAALRARERWSTQSSGLVTAEDWELAHRRGAGRTLDAAQSLRGVLIKACQFASSRPDLLPAVYVQRLSALQDRVDPEPWPVIREALAGELGAPPETVFQEIDEEPVAAASIAQVHRARLRGSSEEVAVKVRYPGVAPMVRHDLKTLESIFEAVAYFEPDLRLTPITDYLRWTLPLELDFGREAAAMSRLGAALSHRDDVVVPRPVESLSTERLLVMEYVGGVRITDREAMLDAGIDPGEVAHLLNEVFAESLFERGMLHADPHPGNLFVEPGPRLVLLDHGLTLDLDPAFVSVLARLVTALREWNLAALAAALREAGMPVAEDTDLDALLGLVGVLLGGEKSESGLGELGRSLGESVGDVPPRLLLVGRAIGLLDGITRQLDPDLDALEIVAQRL